MTVKSMFDYRFPAEHVDEGYVLAQGIGADMIPLAGYLDHEIVRDVKDPGHMMINTRWESEEAAWAVLDRYRHSDKIKRATDLMGKESPGFVGEVGR